MTPEDAAACGFLAEFLALAREIPVTETPSAENPATCPNCGAAMDSQKSPYCGEPCREEAAFVRQLRAALAGGALEDEERQAALGQTLWHVLGGGYPRRKALIPEKAVQKVIEREGGKCEACGAPATTVDHARTACNRPINLRAVCAACCATRPFGDPALVGRPKYRARIEALARRVGCVDALRPCDDADVWDWRDYLRKRAAGT